MWGRLEIMANTDTTAFTAMNNIIKHVVQTADGQIKQGMAPRGKLERKIGKWLDDLQKGNFRSVEAEGELKNLLKTVDVG